MQLPREVIVGKGTLQRVPEVARRLGLKGKALVIAGSKSYQIAGKTICDLLSEADLGVEVLQITSISIRDRSLLSEQ